MSAADLGDAWLRHVLPWLLDASLVAGLILAVVVWGRRFLGPHLRTGLTTLALVDLALPPGLLPGRWVAVALAPDPSTEAVGGVVTAATVLALVHVAGCALVLARCGWQVGRLRRLVRDADPVRTPELLEVRDTLGRRLGIRRPPELRVVDGPVAPCLAGVVRPVVLLPRSLVDRPRSELEGLVAHELVHLRSRDVLRSWLAALVTAVWWFNPLVRALVRQADDACEERCDDEVVRRGLARPERYGSALLQAAIDSLAVGPRLVRPARGAGSLERRLERLGRRFPGGPQLPATARMLILALLALLLLPSSFLGGHAGDTGAPLASTLHLGEVAADLAAHRAAHEAKHRARHHRH